MDNEAETDKISQGSTGLNANILGVASYKVAGEKVGYICININNTLCLIWVYNNLNYIV